MKISTNVRVKITQNSEKYKLIDFDFYNKIEGFCDAIFLVFENILTASNIEELKRISAIINSYPNHIPCIMMGIDSTLQDDKWEKYRHKERDFVIRQLLDAVLLRSKSIAVRNELTKRWLVEYFSYNEKNIDVVCNVNNFGDAKLIKGFIEKNFSECPVSISDLLKVLKIEKEGNYISPFLLGMGIPNSVECMFSNTKDLYNSLGGNTGNLVFHRAIENTIASQPDAVWWGANPKIINRKGNIGIIPCANHFRENFECKSIVENLRKTNLPFVAIGLGYDGRLDDTSFKVSDDAVNLFRLIADRAPTDAPNISLRGPGTLTAMKRYNLDSACEVIGCPSLLLNPNKELGKEIYLNLKPIKNIAILAGNPSWSHLSAIETKLVDVMLKQNGSYIIQHPLNMVVLARDGKDYLSDREVKKIYDYCYSLRPFDTFEEFIKTKCFTFFEIQSWFEFYKKFDFVIGARIHGTILALQAGIPAMCIVHDLRTLEMCEFMKIPYINYKDIDSQDLNIDFIMQKFSSQFDNKLFDENRIILARRYSNFLNKNKIKCYGSLNRLVKSI